MLRHKKIRNTLIKLYIFINMVKIYIRSFVFFLESEISLEQGRAFFVNRRGQIVEVNLPKVNSKV
jgi:hypothetical protein